MIISTKGRYILLVMIDLAERCDDGYVPMKDVAERQEISLKYLEKILPLLTKNHMIEGVHGKGGGYRLTREPAEYSVGEILRLTEGDLAPVACLECDPKPCGRTAECRTLPMWQKFTSMMNDFFDSITIADLMRDDFADEMI